MKEEDNVTAKSASVVNSALWATAGDALGWMTELARDSQEIVQRTGASTVKETVSWKRRLGGWSGFEIELPAGTYSDDTQLRLAVSRSVRGDGSFDAETFAKIELPVWLSYSLGAGRGSKAAAANLARKGVNWFSNFYSVKDLNYVHGGGNGAAMRIQPHIWSSARSNLDSRFLDVLRNSLITHGHAHGFCGAMFHASALADVFGYGAVQGPDAWARYVDDLRRIPERIANDSQLSAFWLTAWEKASGKTLVGAIKGAIDDAFRDVEIANNQIARHGISGYVYVLREMGCFDPKFRGSGLKTAIAASALAWLYRDGNVEDALRVASNEFRSDTDTIATMAGAVLGACCDPPTWRLQDREYIELEAKRLGSIGEGERQSMFSYPDLISWRPPARQSLALGPYKGGLALRGLGVVEGKGLAYEKDADRWQWFRLKFGQTVLVKHKSALGAEISDDQVAAGKTKSRLASADDLIIQQKGKRKKAMNDSVQSTLPIFQASSDRSEVVQGAQGGLNLDMLTDQVIRADFDPRILGSAFLECIDGFESIEAGIAFAAIVTKARVARRKKRSKPA